MMAIFASRGFNSQTVNTSVQASSIQICMPP